MSTLSSPALLRSIEPAVPSPGAAAPVVFAAEVDAGRPAARRRESGLDAMRFIASAGVVWAHAALVLPSALGRFAVPMYLMAAVTLTTFSLKKRADESAMLYLARRWARLYPAFLFWCLVYEGLTQVKLVATGGLRNMRVDVLDFVGGTFEHLWYLPFLLVSTVAIVPLLRAAIGHRGARLTIAALAAIVGFAIAIAPLPASVHGIGRGSSWYWLQHAYWAMPALCLAVALSCVALERGVGLSVPRRLGVLGALMFVGGTAMNWGVVEQPVLLATALSGVGAFWFATSGLIPSAIADRLAPLGAGLGLGIYLSHVLFLRAGLMAMERAGVAPSAGTDLASFAVALAGAVWLSIVLRRRTWTRWMIGL